MMPIRQGASLGVAGLAGLAEMLQPIVGTTATDQNVAWLMRGLLGLGLLACAYLLRDAANTMKETKKQVADLIVVVATHNIMFEHWVDNLGNDDIDNPGRRKSDSLIRQMIATQAAQQQKKGKRE